MPELPEIETIARDLDATVRGARIISARVTRPNVLREVSAATLKRRVSGTTITGSWRRAKLAVIGLSSGDRIVVQPRFTGTFLIDSGDRAPEELQYSTLHFAFADGRLLHYRDIRRLGTVSLMSPARFAEYTDALGIEPLAAEFTARELFERLRKSRQAVKKVLMDQRVIGGVGNIYANEALWDAGIDPSRPARALSAEEAGRLRDAIVDVLTKSVAARGTSFRDYRDVLGERGGFILQLAAYGRAGEPCLRCGTRLVGTHAVDGRITVLCVRCQS